MSSGRVRRTRLSTVRRGSVAAVIMSVGSLRSFCETLHALRIPGLVDALRQADVDYAAGNAVSGDELRCRYGLT